MLQYNCEKDDENDFKMLATLYKKSEKYNANYEGETKKVSINYFCDLCVIGNMKYLNTSSVNVVCSRTFMFD